MQKAKQHGFTAVDIILVVALVAVIGVVGYQAWQNMHKAKTQTSSGTTSQKTPTPKVGCANDETESATNGIFCSAQVGIKFAVPDIFKGKLSKAPNYEVFKGTIEEGEKASSAGNSEVVFIGQTEGNYWHKLTIATEPLRTGYTNAIQGLQNTHFDMSTGVLTVVNEATFYYDSGTGKTTQTSKASLGEVVPSFTVGNVRFFKASTADAGQQIVTYFAVIKDKIVKIQLTNQGFIGDSTKDPTTIDSAAVFKSLDDAIKKLQII